MKHVSSIAALFALVFVSACSDSNRVSTPPQPEQPIEPPSTATIQVVHGSSNAPEVNVTAGGDVVYAAVDYKESPLPISVDAGTTLDIGVDAILPGGDTVTVLELPNQLFEGDLIYTVFAAGNVGDEGDTALQLIPLTRSKNFVPSDTVRVTALHAAAGAPEVDIYVTGADGDLEGVDPINGETPVAFGDSLGPLDIPAGEYRIRITVAGSKTAVAFDSGAVTLEGGTDPIVAAVDNTNAGAGIIEGTEISVPVSALVVSRLGVAEILDAQTTAEIRVTHAVPDVGAPVDVLVDGEVVVPNFEFADSAGPLPLPGGSYVFQVAVGGLVVINPPTEDDDGNPVDPVSTTLTDGVYYDAIAVGSVATENLGLFTAADDRRRLATAAKLRVIHAAPSVADVDLYIVDSTITDISAVDPFNVEPIPYLFNSGYLEVAPGAYNIYVTPTGTKDKAISIEGVGLDAAGIYTAIAAIDAEGGVIGLDDEPSIP